MVKKQDSPRQLHLLREVKHKQTKRLGCNKLWRAYLNKKRDSVLQLNALRDQPLLHLHFISTTRYVVGVSATLFTALGPSVRSKYINSLGQSISPSQLTVRLKFISQLGLITARVFLDRLTTIADHQSQVLTPTRNLIPPHLPKRNRNKSPWHEITTLGTEFSLDFY